MRGEDFSAWLAAIGGMSAEPRRRGLQALMKADGGAGGTEEGAKAGKGGKGGRREDALGMAGVERVESHGCPHCAGREIVGWGGSNGLLRFRCKSCGRTFNAIRKRTIATGNAIRAKSLLLLFAAARPVFGCLVGFRDLGKLARIRFSAYSK
jgi:transposase-like protein